MSTVFVFGSNLAGRHGKGAAKVAALKYGAVYGVGEGRTGDAYAIPTKGSSLEILPLWKINACVGTFLRYARENPSDIFIVTAIGTGLAGYKPADIGPMFTNSPENCFISGKIAGDVPRYIPDTFCPGCGCKEAKFFGDKAYHKGSCPYFPF